MKTNTPLSGLMLEGFQVFDKPTYIPLDRLTLFFGPNSAGKSAVQDAIELILEMWELGSLDSSWYFSDSIKRHWRRLDGNEDATVDLMKLGFKSNDIECLWVLSNSKLIRTSWEISTNGIFLLKNINCGEFSINLNHPLIHSIEFEKIILKAALSFPNELRIENNILFINRGVFGFKWNGNGFDEKEQHWLEFQVAVDHTVNGLNSEDVNFLHGIVGNIGLTFGAFLQKLDLQLDVSIVSASRRIPGEVELDYLFDSNLYLKKGDPEYKNIAISLLLKNQTDFFSKYFDDYFHENSDVDYLNVIEYSDKVNKIFSDHLFLDQGYRVDCEIKVLLNTSINSIEAIFKQILNPKEFSYLVKLFLRDNKGRKHLFTDVGSGIGYALPVLCVVNDESRTCLIQQPELHLHPALQAAMGDVFIEASAAGKQILIETHSEHLLLRILKRIRQTHQQVNIAPDLRINADDLCVLYFDPSPDGSTTVKRLRISEDGEFMDRWPRGFFGERDQELSDE